MAPKTRRPPARSRSPRSVRLGTQYVSTGHLPPAERVRDLVAEAHRRFKDNTEGANSKVYPALAWPANLYVRFPRNMNDNGFSEVGSGKFMGNVVYQKPDDPSSPVIGYRDIDLNGDGKTDNTSVQVSDLKVLPVVIEVHWKGAVGPSSGINGHPFVSYKYTFFKKS